MSDSSSKSWQRVTELFDEALEQPPDERAEFLKSACAGDDDLLPEVQSLLDEHEAEDGFLESPAIAAVAEQIADRNGFPRVGQRLGQYQIEGLLGAGGMGEVYVARDKLDRRIALKVLTQRFPGDQSGLARFQQEARTLLTLNHPHIVTIHDIGQSEGVDYIASELVEGETFRQRLDVGNLRLEELLDIAIQIATALVAAHEHGIIHRDIKPENVMVRRDGFVKVLDFGIAKLADRDYVTEHSAPAKQTDTAAGAVVGTAPYMSPEQARGLKVDARTDIWSLGVVIYEAVAGRKPYSGDTTAEVINSVVGKSLPPLARFAPNVPERLEQIVTRSLHKDREGRYSAANELLADLKQLRTRLELAKVSGEAINEDTRSLLAATGAHAPASTRGTSTYASGTNQVAIQIKRRRLAIVVGILALLIGVVGASIYLKSRSGRGAGPPVPFSEMNISRLTTFGKVSHAAISADGRYVAHMTVDADGDSLWVKPVSASSSSRIAGPSTAEFVWVTFSPDGNWIYYVTLDRDKGDTGLYRVAVQGGQSTMVAYDAYPLDFSPDGSRMTFVRGDKSLSRLLIANADGTNERVLAVLRQPEFFRMDWNAPSWSSDGKTIACQARLKDERGHYETVIGVEVANGSYKPLTSKRWSNVGQPVWLADQSGLLVTASESATGPEQIWHISSGTGEATRVTHDLNNYYDLSITADSGKLSAVQETSVSTIWIAPDGDANRAKQIASEVGPEKDLAWMPDGRIVYRSNAGGTPEIWVMNSDGSNPTQLTTDARVTHGLSVSPDGRYIFFASDRDGRSNIWRIDANGSNPQQLTKGDDDFYPTCAPDGSWVAFQRQIMEPRLWRVGVEGGEAVQLTKTRAVWPQVSPDGQMIAYYYLDPEVEKSRWRIGIVASSGGAPFLKFDFPITMARETRFIRWSPDQRAMAFVNSPNGLSDIWLQPLDGTPPKQLTNFKAEQILAFEWSPGERSLAVVRNAETSDVVLIEQTQRQAQSETPATVFAKK